MVVSMHVALWRIGAGLAVALAVASTALGQPRPPELVPAEVPISSTVTRALAADWLTEAEQADLRVFHGVWTDRDLGDDLEGAAVRRAQVALIRHDLASPDLRSPDVPVEIRAEALVRRGELDEALELLRGIESVRARRLRGEALAWLGRFDDATEAVGPVVEAWKQGELDSAEDLTDAARCAALSARWLGSPEAYSQVIAITGQVTQRVDRLHWPAKLVEAEILIEKDNRQEGAMALHEALALNPRCSEAWYQLGQLAVASFNFDLAARAIEKLRAINPDHPLADLLAAASALGQGMPREAGEALEPILAAMPEHRQALGLEAARQAMRYDEDGLLNALDGFDRLSPGHPWAYATAGTYLSASRQYEWSKRLLNEAIRRRPEWPSPHQELGLMLWQAGDDEGALAALRRGVALDPHNARAAFSLHLLEDMTTRYERVTSEHFVVRFDPETGDRALAEEMLPVLESIHEDVTTLFSHEPSVPTRIELLPNHERFAVRLVGMPDIWTVAACTGPVIAMEAPREGTGHFGVYDWARVIRHEYVHTVTLSATSNRIPHWFTEAAAVWAEEGPRDYDTCRMLAAAYMNDDLFDLDEINWAFVRPKRPTDRSQAYAQGHWMFEFLVERFGHQAMLALLEEYRQGFDETTAMPEVLKISRESFYDEFLVWAGEQVRTWGFGAEPALSEFLQELPAVDPAVRASMGEQARMVAEAMSRTVMEAIRPSRREGRRAPDDPWFGWMPPLSPSLDAVTEAHVDGWLAEHPDHPDLLALKIERMQAREAALAELQPVLERYAKARPVDPLPHRLLAERYLSSPTPERAIPHLEALDATAQYTGTYAVEAARQYRSTGDFASALRKAERAVRVEPFNPVYRELAATVALQAGERDRARHHLEALTIIEPDREVHRKRLEALRRLNNG